MKPEFILMLTHSDQTVPDALDVFEECKEMPVVHWGFKDVGLAIPKMMLLVQKMKESGKTTYLEVVSLSEKEGVAGARLALEAGFDVLMGTVFFDSIRDQLEGTSVAYFPFAGHVRGHPSILDGEMEEIVRHSNSLERAGVQGIDLLSYRYRGDAPELLRQVVRACRIPVVSAGSIETFDRMAEVRDSGAWGFTIGSALFDRKFVQAGAFKDNVMAVLEWLERASEPSTAKGRRR